jgi:hypothetical protein
MLLCGNLHIVGLKSEDVATYSNIHWYHTLMMFRTQQESFTATFAALKVLQVNNLKERSLHKNDDVPVPQIRL